ncbi:PadR family transcriptional regulator [uncultured Enterococcus sp.]|uniref:PadR family transcriptional regulator n=1 Tax=uncultured Enterococcus sp. TaxID=167972 RepID=UPI00374A0E97
MEEKGWLLSEEVVQTEKPNKRVYSLTEAGKQELQSWLSTPETGYCESNDCPKCLFDACIPC